MILSTHRQTAAVLVFTLLLAACNSSTDDLNTTGDSDPGNETPTTGDIDPILDPDTNATFDVSSGNWVVNRDNERSVNIFEVHSNTGVLVNVESVSEESVGGVDYIRVEASGVPNYRVTVDQALLDKLAARPKAATDFFGGSTNLSVGDVVEFGQDIQYKSSLQNCQATGGSGYWPPGPICPQDANVSALFVATPEMTTSECSTDLGTVGLYSNGAAIYNWYDAQTYKGERIWQNVAANAEIHDLDICSGHTARAYHHHGYSACLAAELNDSGDGHSPVYGVSADGYPVHGPWLAKNTLAISSWLARDYDDASSASGCGVSGERSCLLVNQYDVTEGTTPALSNGPSTSDTINSISDNIIPAVSGLYFEDYYHDPALTAAGGSYLDKHNGHNHDGLGYHYHLTMTEEADGSFATSFPFTFGPTYRGALDGNAMQSCAEG